MAEDNAPGKTLRRKLRVVRRGAEEGASTPERAWRVALARALRDETRLAADLTGLSMQRMSLAEVLDLPPERALILTLEGPQDCLGLIAFAPDVTAGVIEMLTLGRCSKLPPEPRKPSRTDAAMIAPVAELAMRNLETALEAEHDLVWTSDYHFASALEDARPLALLLEDVPYRVIRGTMSLADGARKGGVLLVLPAEGKGRRPAVEPPLPPEALAAPFFTARLVAQVEQAEVQVNAVLSRVTLPMAEAMALTVDMVLPLAGAALDRIGFESQDGRILAEGRLGQQRGMRAIRLTGLGMGQYPAQPVMAEPAQRQNDTTAMHLPATGTD